MKKIFELVVITHNGKQFNLLFRNKKKAEFEKNVYYKIGKQYLDSIIDYSYVIDRNLF